MLCRMYLSGGIFLLGWLNVCQEFVGNEENQII